LLERSQRPKMKEQFESAPPPSPPSCDGSGENTPALPCTPPN
jgi:hypothetical protein